MRLAVAVAAAIGLVVAYGLVPTAAPWFALAGGAAAVAFMVARRGRPLAPGRAFDAAFLLAVAVTLQLPAVFGLARVATTFFEGLATPPLPGGRLFVLAIPLAFVAIAVIARRWPNERSDVLLLAGALAIVLPLKLLYVARIEMPPISDFDEMWRAAGQFASGNLAAPNSTNPFLQSVYRERVLPWLLPLRALFGPGSAAYSVPNVLAGAACSLLAWALARRAFGRATARAAFLVSLIAVETWMAPEIPTHDIPGALFMLLGLVVALGVLDRFRAGRPLAATVAAIAWGLLGLVLDLQRTSGPFFLLSCGAVLFAAATLGDAAGAPAARSWRAVVAALLICLVAPFATYRLGRTTLAAAGLALHSGEIRTHRARVMLRTAMSWSDGRFEEEEYLDLSMPWPRLMIRTFVSDLAVQPAARVGGYVRKSTSLFSADEITLFYLSQATLPWGPIDPPHERYAKLVGAAFSVPFLVLFVVGCGRLWRRRRLPVAATLPLAYLGTLTGLLIFFGQVQSRYLYPIWYLGAAVVGLVLAPSGDRALADSPDDPADPDVGFGGPP